MQFFTRFAHGRAKRIALWTGFAMGVALLAGPAAAQVPEMGLWIDHDGKGAIEIKPCADGQTLCGNIVWLRKQVNDQGQPLFDRRNPNEAMRNRPICGLPVIGNLSRTADGWDGGWIYSPEEGSRYDVHIKAAAQDRLVVTGYKGIKLFSKTFTWTRAPEEFADRCQIQDAAAGPGRQTAAP